MLSQVVAGRMRMVTAAHVLDLSTRQVRRLHNLVERKVPINEMAR